MSPVTFLLHESIEQHLSSLRVASFQIRPPITGASLDDPLFFFKAVWSGIFIALSIAGQEFVFAEPPKNKKVEDLFQSMRDPRELRSESGVDFPKLTWNDIPALLERSGSRRILKSHISNPISSRYESEVYEGIYALWLVEGIRIGGSFPSQNPICSSLDDDLERGMDITDKSQKIIASVYVEWWKKREKLSPQELTKLNPLNETKYSWR